MFKDLMMLPLGFWQISTIAIVQSISSTAYHPLVPQMALSVGVSDSMLGTLFALAGIVPVLIAIPIGALTAQAGVKKMLVWGTLMRSSASIILGIWPSFFTLLVSLTISAASMLLSEVGQQAYIASLGRGKDTERNFGWFTFVMGFGMVVGPIGSGIIKDSFGFNIAFLLAGGISLLSLFIIAALVDADGVVGGSQSIEMRKIFRSCGPVLKNVGVLSAILIVVFLYFNLGAWDIYLPALMTERDFTSTQIGFVISCFTFATMMARPALTYGADKLGRHGLAVFCLLLGAAGLASVPMFKTVTPLIVAAAMCGVGRGLVPLLSLVTISDQTGIEDRGLALSIRMMAIRLQSVVHPLVFGVAAGAGGIRAVFFLAGTLGLIWGVWLFFSKTARKGLVRQEGDVAA